MPASSPTFIVECPVCQARVAAIEHGKAQRQGKIPDIEEPYGECVSVGECPRCKTYLVGTSYQIDFGGYDAEDDRWSDPVRIFPDPPKVFSSRRIPKVVKDSLTEADRAMQAGACIAACVMLGRALEALCRDAIEHHHDTASKIAAKSIAVKVPAAAKKGSASALPVRRKMMLAEGIKKMHDLKIIDSRLHEWSQDLRAVRNLAAHPEDITISNTDAADLQTFTNAIVEYVYDLTDRHEEYKARAARRAARKGT